MKRKTFVLDTNVLLFDPQAIMKLGANDVIIPITVIEEMDRFKKDLNETLPPLNSKVLRSLPEISAKYLFIIRTSSDSTRYSS